MNTTTRRTILAGAAALPLLPATALAASVTLPLLPVASYAQPADPAVEAYRVWRAAYGARSDFLNTYDDWDTPEGLAFDDKEFAARAALSDAVATTPAGIACQVRFAFGAFGSLSSNEGSIDNPDDFEFSNWIDDLEKRLLVSMLAGAEGMANA
jgi:hypothetical protein